MITAIPEFNKTPVWNALTQTEDVRMIQVRRVWRIIHEVTVNVYDSDKRYGRIAQICGELNCSFIRNAQLRQFRRFPIVKYSKRLKHF